MRTRRSVGNTKRGKVDAKREPVVHHHPRPRIGTVSCYLCRKPQRQESDRAVLWEGGQIVGVLCQECWRK